MKSETILASASRTFPAPKGYTGKIRVTGYDRDGKKLQPFVL